MITKCDVLRTPNIGLYLLATDRYALAPTTILDSKLGKIRECLSVDVVKVNLARSLLNGALAVGNSHGLAIPYIAERELPILKQSLEDVDIAIVPCKETALGNLILANDRGAIVSPLLSSEGVKVIQDVLGVEVMSSTVARIRTVGTLAVATNKGVLAHPSIVEDELEAMRSILKADVRPGTINSGVGYIRSGLVANSFGALVGSETSGLELAVVGEALKLG